MARYNPMQSVRAMSSMVPSGEGIAWEGKQRGIGREAIQRYINEQARKATKAGRGIGLSQMAGSGLGLLMMALPGWKESQLLWQILAGGGTAGLVSKVGSEEAVRSAGLGYDPAPDVLYGGKEAEEAESYAHSAVDTLISGIDPAALKSAFTTPLTYLTMQNLRTDPSLLTGKKGADLIETDMRTRGAPSFWDLFSQQGWTPTS